MRFLFLLDPFGVWWLPQPVINVFFTMSWPLHFASAVIIIFFWLELVTQADVVTNAGFLTSRRWPAALVIVFVTATEYTTSAIRSVTASQAGLIVTLYVLHRALSQSEYPKWRENNPMIRSSWAAL